MLDFVTVVFQQELPLLSIQARSFDLYVPPEAVNSITVVINDSQDLKIDATQWGQHESKVKFVKFNSVELSGWDSQQLYKLIAASQSSVEWAMILDAKTWFVNRLDLTKILDESNRACHCPAENFQAFSNELAFTEEFFETLTNKTIIGPAGVPFMFHTNTVRALINSIENITDCDFVDWFCSHVANPPRITEFVLYSVYVMYKYGNYTSLYKKLDKPNYLYYNVCDWQVSDFDSIYRNIQNNINQTLTVSVHRRAYQLLSLEQKQQWLALLVDKKLIKNIETNINTLY